MKDTKRFDRYDRVWAAYKHCNKAFHKVFSDLRKPYYTNFYQTMWKRPCISRGVTALTRAVSGEKQIYSGNLEILPGIGKPGKFFGKYEIFPEHWTKIWYHILSNNIYTVICTQCMRCILCILTFENSWTPRNMKRPISNVSNWCNWPHAIPSGLTKEPYRCKAHTISSHQIVQGYFYAAR